MSCEISIVIPTLNEAEGIANTIKVVMDAASKLEKTFEVIVVDDNSGDDTQNVVETSKIDLPNLILIKRNKPRSLGGSVGDGIQNSNGSLVCVLDADLTHNPYYLEDLISAAAENDLVVASRFIDQNGGMPNRLHYFASKCFNKIINVALETKCEDNLSGYFVIKKSAVSHINPDEIFFGYGDYFFRLIHSVRQIGEGIIEVPIRYQRRTHGKSKSNFAKLLFSYSRELLTYRRKVM